MEKLIVSAREARDLLGVSTGEMSRLLHSGEVKAFKRGIKWCIPTEELRRYVIDKATEETKARIEALERGEYVGT